MIGRGNRFCQKVQQRYDRGMQAMSNVNVGKKSNACTSRLNNKMTVKTVWEKQKYIVNLTVDTSSLQIVDPTGSKTCRNSKDSLL